jgi:hypothetical protein
LEDQAVFVLTWHLENFNLDMRFFKYRYLLLSGGLTVIVIIDLFLYLEVNLPALIRDPELLALLSQLFRQLRKKVMRLEG